MVEFWVHLVTVLVSLILVLIKHSIQISLFIFWKVSIHFIFPNLWQQPSQEIFKNALVKSHHWLSHTLHTVISLLEKLLRLSWSDIEIWPGMLISVQSYCHKLKTDKINALRGAFKYLRRGVFRKQLMNKSR